MDKILINDFTDLRFQRAFKLYFKELGIEVSDWKSLFDEMDQEHKNLCYMITKDHETIAFIQFCLEKSEHWFLPQEFAFIRELWVDENYRNKDLGSKLLNYVETYVLKHEIYEIILTSVPKSKFYVKNGYKENQSYKPKNEDTVYTKSLKLA